MTSNTEKQEKLRLVHGAIKKKFKGKKIVFGQGPLNATVALVCDAPDKDEHADGALGNGKYAKPIADLLKSAGIDLRQVYHTAAIKYHAPNHKFLTPKEVKSCSNFLKEELKIIEPKLVITLGANALRGVGLRLPIDNARGRLLNLGAYHLLATYHPSQAETDPFAKKLAETDILKAKELPSGVSEV